MPKASQWSIWAALVKIEKIVTNLRTYLSIFRLKRIWMQRKKNRHRLNQAHSALLVFCQSCQDLNLPLKRNRLKASGIDPTQKYSWKPERPRSKKNYFNYHLTRDSCLTKRARDHPLQKLLPWSLMPRKFLGWIAAEIKGTLVARIIPICLSWWWMSERAGTTFVMCLPSAYNSQYVIILIILHRRPHNAQPAQIWMRLEPWNQIQPWWRILSTWVSQSLEARRLWSISRTTLSKRWLIC